MCNNACIEFGKKYLVEQWVIGKTVIEVGSLNVNGSLRSHIESLKPSKYTGVDIREGNGVDEICKIEDVLDKFGKESFDVVISTELLEHIFDWKKAINNLKSICKRGGFILITTRSYGFEKHGWPHDHWRYELYDMRYIFSDSQILRLEKDNEFGVLMLAYKYPEPIPYGNVVLDDYLIYNINYDLRIKLGE